MKYLVSISVILLTYASTFGQGQETNTQAAPANNQPQRQRPRMAPESTEWYHPVPRKVQPATGKTPPSDAIVLFDGSNLDKWQSRNGEPAKWTVSNGEMIVEPGTGAISTKDYFGDLQLHLEFRSPSPDRTTGQNKGNSGVFLPGGYEVQILNADNNSTYVNGMVGSVYKQSAPLVNAYTKEGEWQVYDIYWKAPRFGLNGAVESPAMVTVVLNGLVVQNNYVLKGGTPYVGFPSYEAHGRMPLSLQDHGNKTAFRNIWVRELY